MSFGLASDRHFETAGRGDSLATDWSERNMSMYLALLFMAHWPLSLAPSFDTDGSARASPQLTAARASTRSRRGFFKALPGKIVTEAT